MPVPTLAGTLCDSMSTDILLLPYIEDSKKGRTKKKNETEGERERERERESELN